MEFVINETDNPFQLFASPPVLRITGDGSDLCKSDNAAPAIPTIGICLPMIVTESDVIFRCPVIIEIPVDGIRLKWLIYP